MGSNILFVFMALMVTVVFGTMAYGLFLLLNPTRTASDRLRALAPEDEGADGGLDLGSEPDALSSAMAERLARLAPASEEEKSRQRMLLVQAGYKQRHALEMFNGVRLSMAVTLPVLVIPFTNGMAIPTMFGSVLFAAAAGYFMPALYLQNIVDKRKAQLLKSFPDCLDLLVSSVEAGLGIDAAFRRVAREMESAAPDLSREFQLVNHEISAGVPRVEALRHLEARTGLEEIRSLVNMLAQAERFGTSIAKSLRVHAKGTRQKRMSRAEEEAAKVSPKLTVVMILFLLPVLFSVLIGPAMINVINTFR